MVEVANMVGEYTTRKRKGKKKTEKGSIGGQEQGVKGECERKRE
jgi:hypothetical protein